MLNTITAPTSATSKGFADPTRPALVRNPRRCNVSRLRLHNLTRDYLDRVADASPESRNVDSILTSPEGRHAVDRTVREVIKLTSPDDVIGLWLMPRSLNAGNGSSIVPLFGPHDATLYGSWGENGVEANPSISYGGARVNANILPVGPIYSVYQLFACQQFNASGNNIGGGWGANRLNISINGNYGLRVTDDYSTVALAASSVKSSFFAGAQKSFAVRLTGERNAKIWRDGLSVGVSSGNFNISSFSTPTYCTIAGHGYRSGGTPQSTTGVTGIFHNTTIDLAAFDGVIKENLSKFLNL